MIRRLFIFVSAALLGAVLVLVLRSAWHRPYESAPMSTPPTADPHTGHAAAPAAKPVNTICAICGMNVDLDLPMATYRNQAIAFACMKCPGKFAKNPEKYRPSYLRNEKLAAAESP